GGGAHLQARPADVSHGDGVSRLETVGEPLRLRCGPRSPRRHRGRDARGLDSEALARGTREAAVRFSGPCRARGPRADCQAICKVWAIRATLARWFPCSSASVAVGT